MTRSPNPTRFIRASPNSSSALSRRESDRLNLTNDDHARIDFVSLLANRRAAAAQHIFLDLAGGGFRQLSHE